MIPDSIVPNLVQLFEHWAWMSRQSKVFAQLMENYQAVASAVARPLSYHGLESMAYAQPVGRTGIVDFVFCCVTRQKS